MKKELERHARNIMLEFWILVLVSFVGTCFFDPPEILTVPMAMIFIGYCVYVDDVLLRKIKDEIERLEKLEKLT